MQKDTYPKCKFQQYLNKPITNGKFVVKFEITNPLKARGNFCICFLNKHL